MQEHSTNIPEGHCQCGCGVYIGYYEKNRFTRGQVAGQPRQFKKGHWLKANKIEDKSRGESHYDWKPVGTKRVHNDRYAQYYEVKREDGRWRREHRVVMETMLGRELKTSEHVHHLDHDGLNNDPANLELLDHSMHSKLHCSFANVPVRVLIDGELVEV